MSAYCITYDLKQPGRNYEPLYDAIKSVGIWWHFLDSTWLVSTTLNAQDIWARLAPAIDSSDLLLVIEVRKQSQGWLPNDAWTWIQANVGE